MTGVAKQNGRARAAKAAGQYDNASPEMRQAVKAMRKAQADVLALVRAEWPVGSKVIVENPVRATLSYKGTVVGHTHALAGTGAGPALEVHLYFSKYATAHILESYIYKDES